MFTGGRISKSTKRTICSILNRVLNTEYIFIVNYPRIVDKLIDSNRTLDESIHKRLLVLGEESIRHVTLMIKVILELGGNPEFDFTVFNKLVDIDIFILDQMEKEKQALSSYQQAKSVAEQNGADKKSELIKTLDWLATDEKNHIMRVQNIISALGIQTKK